MEMIETTKESATKTRPEFDALVGAAMALATQLKSKLIQWGEQMEANARKDA